MPEEQIRYSRDKEKNQINKILFTAKAGEEIYFGIARCNTKAGDNFDKKLGLTIAKGRMLKAKEANPLPLETTKISESKKFYAFGKVPLAEIKDLLQYFHGLDTFHPLP